MNEFDLLVVKLKVAPLATRKQILLASPAVPQNIKTALKTTVHNHIAIKYERQTIWITAIT